MPTLLDIIKDTQLRERRVVITGIGAVTSIGNNVADTWQGLLTGKSGIAPITKFDAKDFRTKFAGEVKNLDLTPWLSPKDANRLDPFCQFAIVAVGEALGHAGIQVPAANADRIGVMIGSGIGGILTLERQMERFFQSGPSRVSPFVVPMMIGDMASGYVAIQYKFRGPNFGVVSACSTGCHAIGESYWIIKRGDADVMIAGGTEGSVTPFSLAGFSAMKALSERNDEPEKASRPFDANRDGFVLSEGAGVMVLETSEHAESRGARILAEVVGYGATADAHHITSPCPDGGGAISAIKIALSHAGLRPEEIDYINAHGTSTEMNDRAETGSIKTVFGPHAYRIPISSTKSLTGHALGAAGGIETIFCVKAIEENTIPGTYNYHTADPECDLNYVPNKSLFQNVNTALNLNFGFGGHNAVLALKRYEQ